MKKNYIKKVTAAVFGLSILTVLTSSTIGTQNTMDANGKLGSTGAPGEPTCSQPGCHGAGNGSGSKNGLADNAGPGSITITANPSLAGGSYVPNQLYHMTVTVSESGKNLFGFDFVAIDNSGSTSPTTNNSVGTITITDASHTRKGQPFNLGRVNVTHTQNGGASANSKSFNFDWKAPASGIVNFYATGNAANGDGNENAADNIYKIHTQLVASVTDINNLSNSTAFVLYPNPANELTTVSLNSLNGQVNIRIYDLNGKLVSESSSIGQEKVSINTTELNSGVYWINLSDNEKSITQKLVVSH